jgi:hypothetical protein
VIPRDEEIRLIAYQIWEEEGRPHGKNVEHWVQAERRWSQSRRSPGDASVRQPGAVPPATVAERPAGGKDAPAKRASADRTKATTRRPARAAAKPAAEEKERGAGSPRKRRQEG